MSETKTFPNFWQALLYSFILPVIILLTTLFPIMFIVGENTFFRFLDSANRYFGHIFSMPILLFFLWKSKIKIKWSEFTNFNIRKILIIIILAIAAEFVFMGTMCAFEKIFNHQYVFSTKTQITYLSVIHSFVLAPIFEEILSRRIFLHQFLKQYPAWTALALSSFLFAIPHAPLAIHFELFIPFFISGLFLGLVYYKTQSVLLCIICHFIMNLFVFLPIWDNIFPWKYLQ